MRPGQVVVLPRGAALALARSNSMRRRQAKDPTSTRDKRLCTKENCLTCCKKFTAFMFSRVGLFLVMIGYVALGGLLFQALEAGNEHDMRRIMHDELTITLEKLWKGILDANPLPDKEKRRNFSIYATNELQLFENTVTRQVEKGFDGRTTNSEHDWNFFGAVLYAVTLISTIGYGHITTKTTQGKIATVLYSAFGVPLMMLFVANIGSTMAKLFAFVFSRITMVFCCRMTNKKKRALALKNRQKLMGKNNHSAIAIDEKLPISAINAKSNLKQIKDDNVKQMNSSMTESLPNFTTDNNYSNELRQLPADMRLNILTGMPNKSKTNSLTSSTNSIGEKSKDAIFRINELIRQNSVQDIEDTNVDDVPERRRSIDVNPIQYYINETNKLTSNLDDPAHDQSIVSIEQDEKNMKQVATVEDVVNEENTKESKKKSKKNLKRSKSESTHDRNSTKKAINNVSSTDENTPSTTTTTTTTTAAAAKPSRRRFFSRKNNKLKKQVSTEDDTNQNSLNQQTNEKLSHRSKSLKEPHSTRSSPPPPDYEQSTINDITPIPTTIKWKGEHEFYPMNTALDLANGDFNDEDYDEDDDDDEESVPLLVTVFVIPLYLTLGAILFSIWERWSFLNAFYFCFITLTTIGFGDFVPGSSLKVEAEKEKLISAAVYILFGLVLIAMCVNLMKEQLSQKVKRVASKLGSF
ncbi:unnamed protein product [Rotaria socialis]|uniref:Potassium channel domain-containing protein n=1 Tax=Rotaria socialis TaxID=392032 RepID=A0A821AIC8_9BILA|nr:unnamed protein product [Rotaria socialis]CAF3332265.1 unnamed protein product [Rotaria socialis]CAF3374356.1 unnamed protein product [Rotaria socialis]CAF3577589.1 unnamed protein product [Rotaria socialis]CAF3760297.1 unnamed protein product [Rotaria socialis]